MSIHPIDHTVLLHQLRWRYATKKFDSTKKIPAADWRALEEALVLTPSSFGLQPWRFIVITDPAVKAQLVPISWGQKQLVEASHVVVFTIKNNLSAADIDQYIARIVEVRGGTTAALAGFQKLMVGAVVNAGVNEWATRQVYIALGNFMTSAALLGIDTCPLEGIEPAKYDALLGLPARGFATVVACAAGYRAADDKYATLPKVRFPNEAVIERL
jgi:nitroreductase